MYECRTICIKTWSMTDDPVEIRADCRYYKKNDKWHVLFRSDNDKCRISFDKGGLIYKRQGELEYELHLINGEETSTRMTSAFGTTSLHCSTLLYELSETKDAINIIIKYNMAEESRKTEIIIKELK